MSARQSETDRMQSGSLQPLRVGLIGIGNMGQHHARVLSLLKNIKLVGIADVNVENGLEAASKYKARYYEDYRDLIPHVDAVCIAVPTRLHYEVGIACLKAGIHVLIEKPIAAKKLKR
jgi:predicted dehydrogenase